MRATLAPPERPPPDHSDRVASAVIPRATTASVATKAGGSDKAEDVLKTFYPGGDVDLRDVKPGSLYVTQTVALDATPLSKGYWSVIVGARVMAASPGGYVPAGLRAYQVGVARSPMPR